MRRSIRPALFAVLIPVALAQVAEADDAAPNPEAQPAAVTHVTVVGNKESEDNYRVGSVDSIGPLGSMKLLDAPYSIGILSSELMQILRRRISRTFRNTCRWSLIRNSREPIFCGRKHAACRAAISRIHAWMA